MYIAADTHGDATPYAVSTDEENRTDKRARVALMTTCATTLNAFFRCQTDYMLCSGYDIHWISSNDDFVGTGEPPPHGVHIHHLSLHRRVTPGSDLATIVKLVGLLRRIRPGVIHTHTPKAGLIGVIAATLARIPVRIYTINGRPSDTARGMTRTVLLISEFVACSLATQVMCVSKSLKSIVARSHPLLRLNKIHIVGDGSSHGVNTETFRAERFSSQAKLEVRGRYGIPAEATVVGFIGRLVPDKGIVELAEAWKLLRGRHRSIALLACGPKDEERCRTPECIHEMRAWPEVVCLQETPENMPAVYAALDICVLPSYREGLPNVLLEAGAMSLPVVATHIAGCVDVVRHEETGLLVETRNARALSDALEQLIENPELRAIYGRNARERIQENFSQDRFINSLVSWYGELLRSQKTGHVQAIR